MGTRGITAVFDAQGELKVAQYGQWDHYPEGQGATVLEFISKPANLVYLEGGLSNCRFISDEEAMEITKQFTDNEQGWMNLEQGDAFSEAYPSLTRNTGAGILELIANSTREVPLTNSIDFIEDTLFCEGIYTINLQDRTFTAHYHGQEYTYSLDALPTLNQMMVDIYPHDELQERLAYEAERALNGN